jgi:long-chain acyl-CoA synthetase
MSDAAAPWLDPARLAAARAEFAAAMARGMSVALWAQVMPEAPAVYSASGDRTFAQLNARSNQVVRALRRRGLTAGDGVALMCTNRAEFAEVFWATRRAGWRITTINWRLTGEEAAYIVDDSDAKAFLVEACFEDAARLVRAGAPRVSAFAAIGGPLHGFDAYEAWLRDEDAGDIPDPQLGASMLYTSGTTGRPKGVHRSVTPVAATSTTIAADYRAGASVHLCAGPLYHAAPLSFSLAVPHGYGAAVAMMEKWDAERALQLIERHRVTHTHMVPTMFHRLLSLPWAVRQRYDLSSLRFVLHGAAPCPVSVKRAVIEWLGPIVHEYYAATEGVGAYVDSFAWLLRPGTVGRPETPGHILILDESGRELPPNEAGLIYLRAPDQGRFTYYKDEQKTSRAYRGDYYTLGDIGYLDAEGYLFITDRSANLIISGGVNIYPAEVEAVLLTHPAVADVGVIGAPNPEWGEEVKAVVELQPGCAPTVGLAAELIEYCRARLAHYKCPRSVDFADALPRHDNGKLYKEKLRERYRSNRRD